MALLVESKLPSGGGARDGKVGAIRASADREIEVFAEPGMVVRDSGDCLADGAGYTRSSAFGR